MKFYSITLLAFLVSCSSNPKLYPNEKYKQAGDVGAKQDVAQCMAEADQFMEGTKGSQVAKGAGQGAAVGAAAGGVLGLLSGGLGRAIAGGIGGAAVGAAAGAAGGAASPDQLKQQYVNRCLSKKGYDVLGWD